jgi:hypothetical protein
LNDNFFFFLSSLHEENIRKFRERQKEYKNDLRNNISTEQRRSVSMKQSAEHSTADLKNFPELVSWSLRPFNIQNLKNLKNDSNIPSEFPIDNNINYNIDKNNTINTTNQDNSNSEFLKSYLQNPCLQKTDFKEKSLKKTYLKSSGCMSVKDVKDYLVKKIKESNERNDDDYLNKRDFSSDVLKSMVVEIYTNTDDQVN